MLESVKVKRNEFKFLRELSSLERDLVSTKPLQFDASHLSWSRKSFPVHSPLVDKVEVDRESVTMRARMYYLLDRIGKEAIKVKEKRLYEAKKRESNLYTNPKV